MMLGALIGNWLISSLAVFIAAYLLPGVVVTDFFAAAVTALVLGIVNAFLKPLLVILTLPLTIITLGLFTLVINALLVLFAARIVPGFDVANFWWALFFSLVLSLVQTGMHTLSRENTQ